MASSFESFPIATDRRVVAPFSHTSPLPVVLSEAGAAERAAVSEVLVKRPSTPPVIRPPFTTQTLARLMGWAKRSGSSVKHRGKLFDTPGPILVLDQAAVLAEYQRGSVELLPLLRQMCSSTVKSASLRQLSVSPALTRTLGRAPPPSPPETVNDSAVDAPSVLIVSDSWNRVPITARVQVAHLPKSLTLPPMSTNDQLADAVFARIPGLLQNESAGALQRSGPFDFRRCDPARRPKIIAPAGKIEKSVMVRSLGRSQVLPKFRDPESM
jgi:hypothetical protein